MREDEVGVRVGDNGKSELSEKAKEEDTRSQSPRGYIIF